MQLTALALSVLLSCALLGCHGDRRDSFYPSLADAKRDGAIDRGWIPDFLPESSHNIRELHDPSSPTTWCGFEFLPVDSGLLRKSLKADAGSLSLVRRVPGPGKSWWPAVLAGDLDAALIHEAGFELYALVEPETASTKEVLLFAIDWSKGRGFFYRTPSELSGTERAGELVGERSASDSVSHLLSVLNCAGFCTRYPVDVFDLAGRHDEVGAPFFRAFCERVGTANFR